MLRGCPKKKKKKDYGGYYDNFILINFTVYLFIHLFRAALAAYGGSQARGLIRAVAASLCQSHSNSGSKPHLRPTPQLRATPDP